MLVKCKVLESFSGIHGNFRRNAEVTFPYDIAQSYAKYGLVKVVEIKDEPEKPTAKLIKDEKGKEETATPKAKRQYAPRKAKTTKQTKQKK